MRTLLDVILKRPPRYIRQQIKAGTKISEGLREGINLGEHDDLTVFLQDGFLDGLFCFRCGEAVGTKADTQRMRFCPYCGRQRIYSNGGII